VDYFEAIGVVTVNRLSARTDFGRRRMEQNRVVVTGLGTVNAIARSVPEFTSALQAGRCGIGPVTVFDTAEYRTHTGGEVQDFAPREMIPRSFSLKRMSRADCMAMAATLEALSDAGLFAVPDQLRGEMGVVIGGGAGGMLECEAVYRDYLLGTGRGESYSRFASFCCASSADRIASQLGIMGPKTTFMTACSSGATAIGYARDLIQTNMAPVVICGGTEPLCRITYGAFNALQAVDPEYCKPFDKNRQGLSLGEGSGIMILEALSHARQRGPVFTVRSWLRSRLRCPPYDRAGPRRPGPRSRCSAPGRCRCSDEGGLHQCPRHGHTGQ
jgi:3-oxoacyl-[acyl-carrier-protein] synthase II